jgi:hypothetical protein
MSRGYPKSDVKNPIGICMTCGGVIYGDSEIPRCICSKKPQKLTHADKLRIANIEHFNERI